MQVSFASNSLRKAYEDHSQGVRKWGVDVSRKYVQRVEALQAAEDFDAIKAIRAFRTHELKGDKKGDWAIELTRRSRLHVMPSADGKAVTVKEVSQHYGD